jgi:biofilm protein TabA
MIVDLLANAHLYMSLSPRIKQAFDYLCQTDLAALKPGTYVLDDKSLTVRVLRYDSRPHEKGVWEAHRRNIDLQYIAEGAELIRYAPLGRLTPGDYDEAKDLWRLSGDTGDLVTVPSGSFMLLWPTDGHMPCLAVDAPAPVKKVVVKIAVE